MHDVQGGAGVIAGQIAVSKAMALVPDNIEQAANGYAGVAIQAAIPQLARYVLKRFAKLHGPLLDGFVYGGTAQALKAALIKLAPDTAARLLADYPFDGAAPALAAYGNPAAALPAGGGMSREQQFAMGAYSTGMY